MLICAPIGAVDLRWNINDFEDATYSETATCDELTIYASSSKTVTIESKTSAYATDASGTGFAKRLKLGGSGSFSSGEPSARVLAFTVTGACKIYVFGATASSGAERTLNIDAGSTSNNLGALTTSGTDSATVEYTGSEGTTIFIYSANSGFNLYDIQVSYDQTVTIASSGYSTFSSKSNVTIPEGITAYQATSVSDNTVTMTSLGGGVIPANTGVVINGTASTEYTFAATRGANTSDDFSDNMLIASSDDNCPTTFTDNETNKQYYALNSGYWKVIANDATAVPDNKAILKVGTTEGASVALDNTFVDALSTGSSSETTGISSVSAKTQQNDGVYYNLQGMLVANPTKGMYIINGKKVIIK